MIPPVETSVNTGQTHQTERPVPLALDNIKQAHGLDPTLRDRIIPRLTRMKTLEPLNVEVRYFLASLYHEQAALSQEVEEYEALYQYETEKERARVALIPLLSPYLQASVDVRRRVLLGQLLREEGRLVEAKGELVTAREQAAQRNEQGLLRDAKYILGLCFAEEGLYEAAGEEIGEAVAGLTVSTEIVDRFYELAQAYEKAGQYEPARRTYNTILRFRPDYRDVESRVRTVSTRSSQPAVAEPRQPTPALVESIGDWATMYSQQDMGRKRYEIAHQLGQGGMGIVYQAYDTEMQTRVALKVISPVLNRNRRVLENFIREAQMTFKLNHPNIVRIHNRGEEMGQHYIAMEYVEGITLRDLLIQREKLSLDEVLRLADGICQGLQYAHTFIDPDSRRKTPVIHRDLKPENVILAGVTEQEPYVTPQTIPKILDFGLSRVLTDTQLSSGSLVKGVSGTYGYMPPEQFDRIKVADERADIYSLGVTVYELLTGRRPFEGDSPAQLMFATLNLEPLPPSEHDAAIPAWLDAVILKCLAKSPEARYQRAAEVQQALTRDRVKGIDEVYRELVQMLYRDDLHLDESERALLEAKRQQLGMSEEEARQIEEEVVRRSHA